jgi:solute:Na+ symporter, SSS family
MEETAFTLPEFSLHPIDYVVIGAYFAIVAGLGYWVYRKTKTGNDLFLAGRSLTWGVVGLSLFASNISSSTLIGLTGTAYTSGIAVANYEWMAAPILIFMCFTTIPLFLRLGIETIPEYLERRFDRRCRLYFSGLNVFLIIFVDTAGGLYAGALVLKVFFPGVDTWTLCAIIALLAGLYTAGGGLKAVAFTDVLQALVLLVGSAAILVAVLARLEFDWFGALERIPEGHLSLIRPADDPVLPWTGTLIGVPLLGFYFWSTNQFITQRILGARNVAHARWGAMLAGLLKLAPLFLMILPGSLALLLYPNLPKGDMVFPLLIVDLLPPGLLGIVLAALIAAVMSSVDSALNSASTLVTLDFVNPRKRGWSPRGVARLGRGLTLGFMVVAALWSPLIQQFPSLWQYLQAVLAYSIPPVIALFLGGIFVKRVSARAGLLTLVVTHGTALVLLVADVRGWHHLHFTLIAGILFALALLVLFVVSAFLPASGDDADPACALAPSDWKAAPEGVAWWADFRLQGVVVLLLTVAMLVAFW